MQKFTLLTFSRNDVDQALELVSDMYELADEIVLVDSSDIAYKRKLRRASESYGKKLRVIDGIALGYSEPLRAFAHKKCRYDWVLRLDSDERITQEFKQKIKKIIGDKRHSAFAIKVYDISNGKKINEFFAWQIQLYRKDCVEFRAVPHEQPSVRGGLGKLTDKGVYIEHHVDLEHTATKEYPQIEKLQRMSYRIYNATLIDHLAKMIMPESRNIRGTLLEKFVSFLLSAYELITFRRPDDEISGFDYFAYYLLRELAYSARSRDLRMFLKVPHFVSLYSKLIRMGRNARDSKEMFEISKKIQEMGVIKFLDLDQERTVRRLVSRYRGKPQGIKLLIGLLKEKYEQTHGKKPKYENIVISPHIDDAFFSLGGLLLRDKEKAQKIVNVFATSDYTINGRMNVKETTRMRRNEEMRNAEKIGAKVEFLPFSNVGSRSPAGKLAAPIRTIMRRLLKEGNRVFFPLGIGGHGDHVFLARIALGLAKGGESNRVYFYEDLPYAVRGMILFALIKRFAGTNNARVFPVINPREHAEGFEPEYVSFSCADKLELCMTYESQVDWRIVASIMCYGRLLGGMLGCRERFWRITDSEYLESLLSKRKIA